MNGRIFFTLFFIGLASSTSNALPSQCRHKRSEKKLDCKLARLNKKMNSLTIPTDVKIVSLMHNRLSDAPQITTKIENLAGLVELDLAYNSIATLPRNFIAKNLNLEEFKMRNNLLRSIDEFIFENNRKLTTIDLSNNILGSLPRRLFARNPRIKTLMLWANDLKLLPEDLLRNNKQLEVINLSWNKLTDIPETFFRGLTNLKKIMLWKNQLTCLYSSMFRDNGALNTFHVAINHIRKVPDQMFDSNPMLEDVRFWSNRLGCIPKELFKNNDRIGYVNLLLGNDGLPWALKQRFGKTGTQNVRKMAYELFSYGNNSCTAAPCEWNPETLTMDCSHRGLSDLSTLEDVCEKVRNLNLDGNLLNDPVMLSPVLIGMSEIRTISAQNNDMSGPLPPEMFKSTLHLSTVDFSRNKLTEVPETTFEANPILKTINLADNEIEYIPGSLLSNNPEVVEVDLSQNKIKDLPETVFQHSRLMTVARLSKNRIAKIDEDTFKNNEKLRELDLSDNKLQGDMFMETFETAPDLETVKLGGNQITSIKKSRKNRMVLERATTLDLSYNKLDEFPVEMIQERPHLKRLILHHNRIASIPEGALHKNEELIEIDLSYNRLTEFENSTFQMNKKLEILRLDHNALKRLEAGLLYKNNHLRFFSANGNKIQYIHPDFFLFNFHLEEIRLSDNRITKLPPGLFTPCGENLRFVTMSGNSLDYIPRHAFDGNDNLESVCLYGNALSRLPQTIEPELLRGSGEGENPDETPRGPVDPSIKRDIYREMLIEVKESNENNYIGKVMVEKLFQLVRQQAISKDDPDFYEDE